MENECERGGGGALSDAQWAALVTLVAKRLDAYTQGDSTSVSEDTAVQVMASTRYCMDGYLRQVRRQGGGQLALPEDCEALFREGVKLQQSIVAQAQTLLARLQANMLPTANVAYNDTLLHGIVPFFAQYDVQFAAHRIPGSIDYPLLLPVTGLQGAEFMREYLQRLTLENDICRVFAVENVEAVLRGYSRDYAQLLINILEPVWNNALGLKLLELPVRSLDIGQADIALLEQRLGGFKGETLRRAVAQAAVGVCADLDLAPAAAAYARQATQVCCGQIQTCLDLGRLERVFVVPLWRQAPPPRRYRVLGGKRLPRSRDMGAAKRRK